MKSGAATQAAAFPAVSAMFPCYNDAPTIGKLVDDVHAALAPIVADVEVIVVNDGSADASREVLDVLATERPWLRVVHHDRNRGYGGALISGFRAARHDWIFYTDGDAQYDAAEAAQLVEVALAAQATGAHVDIVQGYKIGRGDPFHRKVIGRVYHHVVKLGFRLPVRDTDCDFRLFRRELFTNRPLTSHTGVICVEMMHSFHRQGARFVETPVHHYPRPVGRSQFFRIPAIARSALQLTQLWWRVMLAPRLGRNR